MDTRSIYGYFLPTQGIDVARGQTDLRNLFGQPREVYSIEIRTIGGRSGFYIRASLDLSRGLIARLAGCTPTPLERLSRIETRRATPEPGCAAASARRVSQPGTSPTASYQTHPLSDSGPASQPAYAPFSTHTPASSHRRESDAEDRRQRTEVPRSLPTQPMDASERPVERMDSYSAEQYYRPSIPQRGQDEGTRSSDPDPRTQNGSQQEEEYVSPDAQTYDATNDAFFFPPNSVSAEGIQRRRQMLNGTRGAIDR